jgi:5-methylcytosine-specific restriction endonuclease McrA
MALKRYAKHPEWFRKWAMKFYKSDEWMKVRQIVRDDRRMHCDICHKLIKGKSICDHIIELSPDNYTDPDITLNVDNLRLLCLECHNTRTFKGVFRSDPVDFDLSTRKNINLF